MNNLNVLIFLLAVFLASEAVTDASRIFNMSGWFDTGFSIGHRRQVRRHRIREDLPIVAEVKHFKIPDVFTQAKATRQADDEPGDKNEVTHHHGRHGRHRGDHRH